MPKLSLKAALKKGLNPLSSPERNADSLEVLRGAFTGPEGCTPHVPVSNVSGATFEYPYPKFVSGPFGTFAFDSTHVHAVSALGEVAAAGSVFDISPVFSNSPHSFPAATISKTASAVWQIAKFENQAIATNGTELVLQRKNNYDGTYSTFVENVAVPTALCEFRNILLLGGCEALCATLANYGMDFGLSNAHVMWGSLSGKQVFPFLDFRYALEGAIDRLAKDIFDVDGYGRSRCEHFWTSNWIQSITAGTLTWIGGTGLVATKSGDPEEGVTGTITYTFSAGEKAKVAARKDGYYYYILELYHTVTTEGMVYVSLFNSDSTPTEVSAVVSPTLSTLNSSVIRNYYIYQSDSPISKLVLTLANFDGVIKRVSLAPTDIELSYSDGSYTVVNGELLDSIKTNDWGYIQVPFKDSGVVTCMKPMHNCVIVYGTTGVFALLPKLLESMTTWTVIPITDIGIYSTTSVVGNEQEHYFVDSTGSVWHLNSQFEVTRVYYDNEFSDAVAAGYLISGTTDFANSRMYLSIRDVGKTGGVEDDPTHLTDKSLVFSSTGLSEVREAVSDIYTIDADRRPFGYSTGQQDTLFYLKTGVFDLGTTDVKTFKSIRLQADSYSTLSARLWYQSGPGAVWRSTGWISANYVGDADFYVSGIACYIEVKDTVLSSVRIYDIELEFEGGNVLGTQNVFRRIV